MLVVRVELHSAITGLVSQIAVMKLWNTGGGTPSRGDYKAEVIKGRIDLPGTLSGYRTQGKVLRTGCVADYPRKNKHVWNLVARMLTAMGYK